MSYTLNLRRNGLWTFVCRGQGQQDRDRGASAQFLLWLCDQVEADNQPSPAWLIGPDVAEWTMGEIKQVSGCSGCPEPLSHRCSALPILWQAASPLPAPEGFRAPLAPAWHCT